MRLKWVKTKTITTFQQNRNAHKQDIHKVLALRKSYFYIVSHLVLSTSAFLQPPSSLRAGNLTYKQLSNTTLILISCTFPLLYMTMISREREKNLTLHIEEEQTPFEEGERQPLLIIFRALPLEHQKHGISYHYYYQYYSFSAKEH